MNKKILITGGAGYVGSHVCKNLSKKGFEPIVFDNLSRGNKWSVKWGDLIIGDLSDKIKVDSTLEKICPIAIIHLAAFADIGESNLYPEKYYRNNVDCTLNLIESMIKNKLKNLVFSSSCSIYGNKSRDCIDESTPQNPLSPYAFSKYICERLIVDIDKKYDLKYFILRYFNAAGADIENEIGEKNLFHKRIIPEIVKTFLGKREKLKIFGKDYDTKDGTCVRDYVHIEDLSDAHFRSINYLLNQEKSENVNIGSGQGYTILEIVRRIKEILQKDINIEFCKKRSGDADYLVASIEKAQKVLNWFPKYSDLDNIINTTLNWEKKN
jgi:UDP-glucose 4-epimerase